MDSTTLKKGFWVAISVKKGSAPLRAYVGQIQEIDQHGIRITLIDWLTGTATGYDLFVPWDQMGCCEIATPDHAVEGFGKYGEVWQERMILNDRFDAKGYTYCDACLKDTRRITKSKDGQYLCDRCYGEFLKGEGDV